MREALPPHILPGAQVSAILAREVLEVVMVLLHKGEEDDSGLNHTLCSGGHEIVELACAHIRDVEEALSEIVKAVEAEARS